MSRRSLSRLLALGVLLVLVALDGVLIARLPPAVQSTLFLPRSGTSGAPPNTAPPATGGSTVGTYWTCESSQTDSGTVGARASPPPGGVWDGFCEVNSGRKAPGQRQPDFPPGTEFWRVPVGSFTPYVHCGARVTNIEDPYDPQAAPRSWPTSHKLLLDSDWKTVESGGVCPNPHPATAAGGQNAGTYWTCGSNETNNGSVIADAPAPVGGVWDAFCQINFGRKGPGQRQPDFPSGTEFWRVPVGTFTPYIHCGVKVTNIADPYDPQAATWTWPTPHRLLLDPHWKTVESGGVCPNPHPATTAPGAQTAGTYWTCGTNETDKGNAIAGAPAPVGGAWDALCEGNFGRRGPGQQQPDYPSDIEFWRVPVGTFTPYVHCGVKVANIEDPYDPQAAPRTWPASHKRLLDANWNTIKSGSC